MSGQLVRQWPLKPLGELCQIRRGQSPRPIKSHITDDEDGVNWIKISDAGDDGKYIFHSKQKIHRKSAEKLVVVNDGDFILTNSMSFGRPYIVRTTGCVHDGWLIFSEYQNHLNQDYLYYALNSPNVSNQFEQMARGSTVRNLNIELVKKTVLPVPSLEEQQRIVSILDETFEEVENRTSQIEHKLDNGKEMFQSVIASIFSQKGEGWTEKTLEEVCELFNGNSIPAKVKQERYTSGQVGIPYIGTKDVAFDTEVTYDSGVVIPEDDSSKFRLAPANSTLICAEGGSAGRKIGFTSRAVHFGNKLYAIVPSKALESKFVFYFFRSDQFKRQFQSRMSGMIGGVSQSKFKTIQIPIPSLNEQQAIVNKLDSLSLNVALLEENHRSEIESLVELKQSILHEAFNGTLRIE